MWLHFNLFPCFKIVYLHIYIFFFQFLSNSAQATCSWQSGQEFFCSSHFPIQVWWKKCPHFGRKAAWFSWSSKQIEQGSSFCLSESFFITSAFWRRWISSWDATPGMVGWSTIRPSGVTNIWGRPRLIGAGVGRWYIGGKLLNRLVSDWVGAAAGTPKGLADWVWSCMAGRPATNAKISN